MPHSTTKDSSGEESHAKILADHLASSVKIIGLYGISGSGKTTLLNYLRKELDVERFAFYEGSEVIKDVTPGGLETFQKLDKEKKTAVREKAISTIYRECSETGRAAIITGHFMFWSAADQSHDIVCTQRDLALYTHIIYLDTPPELVKQYCSGDASKQREPRAIVELSQWQQAEIVQMRPLCRAHNILFTVLKNPQNSSNLVPRLIRDFETHGEEFNERLVAQKMDQIIESQSSQLHTVLVIDGDKTLTPHDTGTLFWKVLPEFVTHEQNPASREEPLKALFGSELGYTYNAFRQATLLYEEITDEKTYENICREVASSTGVHAEFLSLLRLATHMEQLHVVIVSCGLRRVWEMVLEKENLRERVDIIAGGRIKDELVVTATTKANIVSRLQETHQKRVWAFGDSPLDLDMLKEADKGFVVVVDEDKRSKSMETALSTAIDETGLKARQIIIPNTATPRLSISSLPLVDITTLDFINEILYEQHKSPTLPVFIASIPASKLLATPMRDAAICGPALQEAHSQAGWYLAHEHLAHVIGLEPTPISHVLGHCTNGSRFSYEAQTTIVSLMRGGDPMARGVSKALPRAMYVHIKNPQDLHLEHLEDQVQAIVVDSVVNTGKSIVDCVDAIRRLHQRIRIIIVAGVVQAECLRHKSLMYQALLSRENVAVVALRVSDTKFTGSGTTDTGNRLFNSTRLS